jgi:hypothetical protein
MQWNSKVKGYLLLCLAAFFVHVKLFTDFNLTSQSMTYYLDTGAGIDAPSVPSSIPTCVVNMHIPKVGGRTVGIFLTQVLMGGSALNFSKHRVYGSDKDKMWPKNNTDRIFVQGHFSTEIFRVHPELQECFAMTVLRQPVDRAISAFFYHNHRPSQLDYCLSSERKKRIRCRNYWQYSNDMTLRLAGPKEIHWKSSIVSKLTAPTVPRANESHLADAKRNLKKYFDVVCFLHDLPSCANQILETFQIDPSAAGIGLSMMTERKDNQYKTRTAPTELVQDDMRKFQEANHLDLELYNWALSTYSWHGMT